ncbi:MAG: AAA family ATPase [Acidimicrobiales bacterium]
MNRLDLVVGPNGSGKSTFVRLILAPEMPGVPFVNPDAIAVARWPEVPEVHAYEAMALAVETRSALIARGDAFIAESVFSHESKLDLIRDARDAGYIVVMHVMPVPEEVAVSRVARRVRAGGHDVPEEKIRTRHQRLWPLVCDAITLAHSAIVWDDSLHDGSVVVAQLANGILFGHPTWPLWTPSVFTERWPRS